MKKTLALALVAAMTISMVSMTAFAGDVAYSDAPVTEMENYTAEGSNFTADEVQKMLGDDYKVVDGALYKKENVETVDGKAQPKAGATAVTSASVPVDKAGLKAPANTPTRTFKGWKKGAANSAVYVKGATPVQPEKNIAFTSTDGKTFGFEKVVAVTEKATTDKDINENLKKIDETKKGAEDDKKNADKLQKLDEKYGANTKDDATNGYVSSTGKATDITTDAKRKTKGKEDMNDFYWHSIKVAGAPDSDGDKTWVFDVSKTDGTSFGEGNTARVEFDLGFTDADLSKFTWKVYHIEGWCKAEKVKNVEVVGNKLYVWTDKFSPFVVTRGDINAASAGTTTDNPSTGDFSAVPVALLAAAALGATGFVAYKKRKAE